tara:strand:+ start:150 stop:398 length:249 start_codon:yes stop_codon:yes gene_type:complete
MAQYSFKKEDLNESEDLKLIEEERELAKKNKLESQWKFEKKEYERQSRSIEEEREKGIHRGPRSRKYTNDETKDGRPYRRYF